MLHIQLFGGLTVRDSDTILTLPARDPRALFAYLSTYPDRAHTRSRLAGLFWPELNERTARCRLSHALWQINAALPKPDGASYLVRDAMQRAL